ncbi:MAG: hypothetical protein Q8754_02525 [Sweet potato little leaf phytoplasma]|nr:hypothetical protein [Sweet potato little leaf phytoplasma]
MGNPRAFRALRNLISERNPQIVFVSETKCGEDRMNKIKVGCKFEGCLSVPSSGLSGGLCLLWKDSSLVTIRSFSNNHIDAFVEALDKKWRFTGIYGFADTNQKKKTWDLLRLLDNSGNDPWLLGGDFNEILEDAEKEGGPSRNRHLMDNFKQTINDCRLKDLDFIC